MIFRNTICLLLVSFFFSNPAHALSRRDEPCVLALQTVRAEGASPSKLSLEICTNRCGALPYDYRVTAGFEVPYQSCVSQLESHSVTTAQAGAACSSAVQSVAACKGGCKSLYDSCVSSCQGLATATERTEALRRCDANYRGKPAEVAEDPTDRGKDKKPEPLSPIDDDKDKDVDKEANPEDPAPAVADTGLQNTGNPNVAAQMPALNGLGSISTPDPNIGSTDAGAIDFSSGPGPERDAYAKAGAGVTPSDAVGAVGQNPLADQRFAEGVVGGGSDRDSEAKSGGPNGANAGMMPPIAPQGNGQIGAQNNANAQAGAKGKAGGGYYRNAAGDYLSRHSPFSYQGGGTSNLPGSKNGARTVANKKPPVLKYNKKENDGKEALNRLFGNGLAPASYRRNPYGAGSGRTCKDSVFCKMETFYNKIERFPNHDINPDSY